MYFWQALALTLLTCVRIKSEFKGKQDLHLNIRPFPSIHTAAINLDFFSNTVILLSLLRISDDIFIAITIIIIIIIMVVDKDVANPILFAHRIPIPAIPHYLLNWICILCNHDDDDDGDNDDDDNNDDDGYHQCVSFAITMMMMVAKETNHKWSVHFLPSVFMKCQIGHHFKNNWNIILQLN